MGYPCGWDLTSVKFSPLLLLAKPCLMFSYGPTEIMSELFQRPKMGDQIFLDCPSSSIVKIWMNKGVLITIWNFHKSFHFQMSIRIVICTVFWSPHGSHWFVISSLLIYGIEIRQTDHSRRYIPEFCLRWTPNKWRKIVYFFTTFFLVSYLWCWVACCVSGWSDCSSMLAKNKFIRVW